MNARHARVARVAAGGAVALVCTGLLVGPPAAAQGPSTRAAETPATVRVVARGLEGPRQLSVVDGYFLVAESDAARVSAVRRSTGARTTVVADVPTAQGVVESGGRIYTASGEASPDADPGAGGGTALLVARPGRAPRTFADLLAYEQRYNPDNQTQLGPDGKPLDALSNPYVVIRDRYRHRGLLVADAGANDVLAVDRHGRVSTFFVPPSVTTGTCADRPNNSDAGNSCDSVPTGLAYGPHGRLYVSALTGEAEGEGRVYVVDRYGKLEKTLAGFSGPTGVAVASDGTVYVSEVAQGAPQGPPPAGFDPSTIGQVVRVAPDGTRTYAQVTMPGGLLLVGGRLYACAWAIAGLLGTPHAGQVVEVDPASFRA